MKQKIVFIIFLTIILGVLIGFLTIKKPQKKNDLRNSTISTSRLTTDNNALVIPAQNPGDKVMISQVILKKNGFVVVRQLDGGRLSQIIEMSQVLSAGNHKNIMIPLDKEEIKNKELIVMLYDDYANDGIFNDLDMPSLTENGTMIANFVRTGMPLPSSIVEADQPKMNMPGVKAMAKVVYTDQGFVPNKVQIKAGEMVEFINESSQGMWVASIPHPAHTKLPTFDQFKIYGKGARYRYIFEKKGTWEFHDHINPAAGGVVSVS